MSRLTKLELYVADKVKKIDPHARPTKGSGAAGEVQDIQNKYFIIECKEFLSKSSIGVEQGVWDDLMKKTPCSTKRIPFCVMENKSRQKCVIIDVDTFFELMYKLHERGGLE